MRNTVFAATLVLCGILVFGCAQTKSAGMKEPVNSGIRGQIIVANEGAAAGAFVYAYDSPYNDMRVPTKLISPPAAQDGSYQLDLAPGTYYIVARRRVSGDPRGYLVKGDYEGKYMTNPVVVEPGSYKEVNISISKLEGAFLMAPYLPEKTETGISGTVKDENGTPVRGAYVMVYTDSEMIGLPQHLSRPTDADGGYTVPLPPGTYYVAARLKYGGLPRKGEPYGTYDQNKQHMVEIGEKELMTGVDVTLKPFPLDLAKPVD